MGREFYRSDDFIIYHCDGCDEYELAQTSDEVEGADTMQKAGWSIWRPMAPDDHLKLIVIDGKKVISCDPVCDEDGNYVERHYCPVCASPKTDWRY